MPAKHSETALRKNELFEKHIGLILNAMILEAVGPDEHRTNNTKLTSKE
jgi:hypothetical protein